MTRTQQNNGSVTTGMVRVETRSFQFAHGRSPRGNGDWAFRVGNVTVWFSGMFATAAQLARRVAAEQGEFSVEVMS